MPGPNPRFSKVKPKPDEYNKKGSLGKSKLPKKLVPTPPPKKMKKKSKFPDHSGDGKITKKDILMAKGIIPKKKKKGKK